MSLRVRLTLLIVFLFFLRTVVVSADLLVAAQQEMSESIGFSRRTAAQFVDLLTRQSEPFAQEKSLEELRIQLQQLQTAGRFSIDVSVTQGENRKVVPLDQEELEAPMWFLDLLGIDANQLMLFYDYTNGSTLAVHINVIPEINEIWDDIIYILTVRFPLLLTVFAFLFLLIGHWMRPVADIITALEQLVKGNFSKRIPMSSLAEINEVSEKINVLANALGESKAENERLTRQAMTIQEQERRFLAQELHDSLGQAVSAIKAMAVSIANRTRKTQPLISETASTIEKVSDDAYQSVRNLMTWLRPAILDELGLALALQQMVDDWNVHHEDTFCILRNETDLGDLKEQQQIQVYRIVQEAFSNIAKHAQADRVNVVISGEDIITLVISDNGKGFKTDGVRMGIGLSNIRDRANLLHGTMNINSTLGEGTTLQIEFPRSKIHRGRRGDK